MRHIKWTLLALVVVASGWASAPLQAAEPGEPVEAPVPADWRERRAPVESEKPLPPVGLLIERLASPKFAERAQASRDLVRMGVPAVDALLEAAKSDQPERSQRAVAALEDLFLKSLDNDEDEATDAAFKALDELSLSDDAVLRSRVEAALAANESELYKNSLEELLRLGASVRYLEGVSRIDDFGKMTPDVDLIFLDKKWTGGTEGLRHVRRVRPNRGLYIISGSGIPAEAIAKFKAESQINVQSRGRSQLGIVNHGFVVVKGGVVVGEIDPTGAAAKAGILPNDVITEFNGGAVTTFDDLVKKIEVTEPGQEIPVKIIRGGEAAELTVTMGSWKP